MLLSSLPIGKESGIPLSFCECNLTIEVKSSTCSGRRCLTSRDIRFYCRRMLSSPFCFLASCALFLSLLWNKREQSMMKLLLNWPLELPAKSGVRTFRRGRGHMTASTCRYVSNFKGGHLLSGSARLIR